MTNSDDLLTVAEFAKKVRLTRQAIHKAIKEKRIKAIRIGYVYLIPKDQIAILQK